MPRRIQFWVIAFLAVTTTLIAGSSSATQQTLKAPDPDAACAKCHRKIYDSYKRTPMAQASGIAADGLIPGDFLHAASGVHYRLFLQDGRAWLSYQRPNATPERTLDGKQELIYYLGSGKRGRTYLFQQEAFWFEIPVNWYAKKQVWDMAPHFLQAKEMPLTLPIDAGCLRCHASDVQTPLPGGRNHYAGSPFLHGGIGCAACHGDPSSHLAQNGKGPILNPNKLDAIRRDSACLQCHLEGESTIARSGHSLTSYRPGDNLFDHIIFFVHKDTTGPAGRATSQWEALLESKCKQQSGDKLTCTTCHDPHNTVEPEKRVSYYRAKCLTCHNDTAFIAKHHPENPDCASCHMPRQSTTDIAHEQVTDHRIQKPASLTPGAMTATSKEIVTVDNLPVTAREYGLAYAQMALHGDPFAIHQAMRYLKEAEQSDVTQASDAELHTQLGFLAQRTGDNKLAATEYETALKADPHKSTAAGDLAILRIQAGDLANAIPLLQSAFLEDPEQLAAGYDLAVVQCNQGNAPAAIQALNRVLLFSPDDTRAHAFLLAIKSGAQPCGQHQ
ncbi:tetratricopeptide repeat protein [Alloacidobacterium dinghuense]|uniref:Tetratricopeptide repeat protein n=1 Tax=Alloacidobacterium dinghuense TaxID=2763107 RepID=A0A7G8BCI9_9BACT|nr:tetratricopeptide repeat protein [Alloacidobacterium dinghuense]QNI30259.1 tetratricopeptide repeat protein [Alloacidobacterium dinghuense]